MLAPAVSPPSLVFRGLQREFAVIDVHPWQLRSPVKPGC